MTLLSYHRTQADMFQDLLEKADLQGYLTAEDILEVYPQGDKMPDLPGKLLAQLRHRGIDIVELDDAPAPRRAPRMKSCSAIPTHPTVWSMSPIEDTVEIYLKEMSRVPLLKVEEEVSLAKRIECGKEARLELAGLPARNHAARRRELEAVIEDGRLAREHLIKANTRLVVSIAKTLHRARRALPRPDPGGQPGLDESRREVSSTSAASASPPMPPGGSARPSPAPSPTRGAPSACRCT